MIAIRAATARLLPQGAILLAILTFAAYAAGLVRDRVFARTYGAGTELDAYNAAFVLPELLLDVLVASGLTAPFVPVFTTLRGRDPDAAPRFAQTVLTLAILVMAAGSLILLVLAPASAAIIVPGFNAQEQALYVELFRIMLLTPILFAASIALGEVLVAERRFVYYALAPILYNAGIAGGTLLLHDSLGIKAAAWGAVIGAALHLGIRVVGMLRSTVPLRLRLDVRMPAVREFVRLMIPKMVSHPIEPLTFLFFTAVASTLAAGLGVVGELRAQLPERAGGADRGVDRARRLPGPVGLLGGRRPRGLRARRPAPRDHDRRPRHARGRRPGRRRPDRDRGPAGRRQVRRRGRRGDVGDPRGVRAGRPVRRPRAPRRARPVRDPQHAAAGARRGRRVRGHDRRRRCCSCRPSGVLAIPLGFAAGTATRTILQGIALARRMRTAPMPSSAASPAP